MNRVFLVIVTFSMFLFPFESRDRRACHHQRDIPNARLFLDITWSTRNLLISTRNLLISLSPWLYCDYGCRMNISLPQKKLERVIMCLPCLEPLCFLIPGIVVESKSPEVQISNLPFNLASVRSRLKYTCKVCHVCIVKPLYLSNLGRPPLPPLVFPLSMYRNILQFIVH